MGAKKADIREWMLLTRNNGQVLGEEPTAWEPWTTAGGLLPAPEESMRDVAHEALVDLSERSAERGYARLSSPAAFFVEDVVMGRVLTLDDGTELWMAGKDTEVEIAGMGRCPAVSFVRGHVIVLVSGKEQAFPHARLSPAVTN